MNKYDYGVAILVVGLSLAWSATGHAQAGEVEPNEEGPPQAVSTQPVKLRYDATGIGPSPVVFSMFKGAVDGGSELRPYPPDPHGAVGPAGIMQVVNEQIVYLRRDGTFSLITEFGSFLPGGTQIQDPQIQYDAGTGRFFLTGIETHRLGCSSDCFIN